MSELPYLAIAAFEMLCEGTGARAPLRVKPAHASVTVFQDGAREVGCGFLNIENGACMATENAAPCIQLFPASSLEIIPSEFVSNIPEIQQEFKRYHTTGKTIDGRRVGLWKDDEGNDQAEIIPDGVRVFPSRREFVDPIGPSDPLWEKLQPETQAVGQQQETNELSFNSGVKTRKRNLPTTEFGNLLGEILASSGIFQKDLAEAVNIAPESLSRAMRGGRRPSAGLILKISEKLSLNEEQQNQLLVAAGYIYPITKL